MSSRPRILLPPGFSRSWAQTAAIAAGASIVVVTFAIVVALQVIPRRDKLPDPAPSVVIALGAGMRDDSTLSRVSTIRLEAALSYARTRNAGIVTTRAYANNGSGSDRAQRTIISRAGLADRWTALPGGERNTRDEALAMHMVIPDTMPIAVITSPLHTRRACATFERVGYRVTCIASPQDDWWFVPYSVVYEIAAYIKYKMKGWV